MGYKPEVNRNYKSGLQLNRTPFIIEQDAFAKLYNAYVWRGRIKKKEGTQFLGRLQLIVTDVSVGNTGATPWTFNLFTASSTGTADTNKDIIAGSVTVTIAAGPDIVFTDTGLGTLTSSTGGNSGTINYATGGVTLIHTAGAMVATTATFTYAPGRPVMGLPYRVLTPINDQRLYGFDTRYSYIFNIGTQAFEQAPTTVPTVWTGSDSQLFWPMNAYNALWVTNGVKGLQAYNVVSFTNPLVGPPITIDVATTEANSLSMGDQVIFVNIVTGDAGSGAKNNGLRGKVELVVDPMTVRLSNPDGVAWTSDSAVNGKMIVANQNVTDPPVTGSGGDGIRWHDGTNWINFNPVVNPTNALMGAQMIFYYRGRIVALYPTEGASIGGSVSYGQRARWCQIGTPFDITPVPLNSGQGTNPLAWRSDVPGYGGYIDAPTQEEIVSAYFLRDILIVSFENSTWKLQYTNNRVAPFVWEKLNTELGADAQFSAIPFDKQVLFVGPRGIIASNGVGVERIDQMIPDVAFEFRNTNSGPERICGIRDYIEQVVMWTLPNTEIGATGRFPNSVLLYNYLDGSWSILGDSFTCYGYWQPLSDVRWQDLNNPLSDTWELSKRTWAAPSTNPGNQQVIAGNQVGFVSKVLFQVANDISLKVNGLTVAPLVATRMTITDHNLKSGQYVLAADFLGTNTMLNGQVFSVNVVTANLIELYQWNASTGALDAFTGGDSTYIGNGKLALIDDFTVMTKKFNPFLDEAVSVRMKQIDFYVDATTTGRFAVNLYVNDEDNQTANPPDSSNPLSNRVETFPNPYEEQEQQKLWHSLFDTVTGNLFQIECTYDDAELNNPDIFNSGIVIHSIAPQSSTAARRLT